MKIAEIFYSIQGEGSLVGVPSVFVRTSGCNLRCTWCDTPYTSWQPEGDSLSVQEVVGRVAAFRAGHVVITGGEPLIAPELAELAEGIGAAGAHITIETAGTVFQELRCDLMSISPKLANSTPWERDEGRWAAQHERLRFKPNVLRQLMDGYPYQLKFVVSSLGDLDEIAQMQQQLTAPAEKIILMPEGVNRDVLRERGLWLAEICKERGYRFSPRLHVELWGDRRGI